MNAGIRDKERDCAWGVGFNLILSALLVGYPRIVVAKYAEVENCSAKIFFSGSSSASMIACLTTLGSVSFLGGHCPLLLSPVNSAMMTSGEAK